PKSLKMKAENITSEVSSMIVVTNKLSAVRQVSPGDGAAEICLRAGIFITGPASIRPTHENMARLTSARRW
ncbi:MAG: hypothetical protein PVF79_24325, partial [Desulfobacterales bacterium]